MHNPLCWAQLQDGRDEAHTATLTARVNAIRGELRAEIQDKFALMMRDRFGSPGLYLGGTFVRLP